MTAVRMESQAVCARLATLAGQEELPGTVHTVFDHAVNVVFGGRLVSLLTAPRCLVPYGCTVSAPELFPLLGFLQGEQVVLNARGLRFAAGTVVELEHAVLTDLSVDSIKADSQEMYLRSRLQPVLSVLQAGEETQGLSVLVAGGEENVYSTFIAPRLAALFEAVGRADPNMPAFAGRVAGCGVGLTPSSDDLLTGYFLTIRLLSRFRRMGDIRPLLPAMAAACAEKTNRISGAFLSNSGEGLASLDVLSLLNEIFTDAPDATLYSSAQRVASLGSTSGRDMLTGLVLAIQHHDGGKNSDQTGNQEERIL